MYTDLEHISLANFGPVAYVGGVVRLLRFLETTLAHQFSSTRCTAVSFPATRNTQLLGTLRKFCNKHMFWRLHGAAEAYSWITVIHFSRYATVNSTNVLSSHWFSFMWLAYSENKLFRAGPNICSGGTNFRWVQIKHDTPFPCALNSVSSDMSTCKWSVLQNS